ncbi:MAG: hypothetical protein P0Y53_02470 [Candidatus Pseudobacter hemicellulosilyticus]|uniref:Uncharacterized protein n=1 Tax=Candidatus Pseudobacter hemicellulosilyticus TaxID=3121375 RepID=A0AAJ5WTL7_9BACT|nr:MAG: hypothetical protein P0Y53_02470 [Pseudobacter sp.]
MKMIRSLFCAAAGLLSLAAVQAQNPQQPLQISGVYPHLTVFNEGDGIPCKGDGSETGIGAVVPWAGKLWMITYSPHCPGGSSDKLFSVDNQLQLTIHPESVGGTPAGRMIHRESNQLIIGPYFIDAAGKVRVIPPTLMPGRITAAARHLEAPANKVYFYDMEGMVYEADVHTLAVTKLFNKPVPGWHGKGGYTAQKRFIITNNGEHTQPDINPADLQAGAEPREKEEVGVLASWDGRRWSIIERRPFTDVTGPGGIYGAPDDKAPAWSMGWDRRSVLLKLLDGGKWYTYRLPKSTHTYDSYGGWYTEWPRIREVGNGVLLMDMHGLLYNFPKGFSRARSAGISPINTHLRYIPDYTEWNGRLVIATDETSILQNPFAGRSQSNLWFGQLSDLQQWGVPRGWGGPWAGDAVKAGTVSDPFLVSGFDYRVLHLSHDAKGPVSFNIELDEKGNNQWKLYKTVIVDKEGYGFLLLPSALPATWARVKVNTSCVAGAFFHLANKSRAVNSALFNGLAGIEEAGKAMAALIRPAAHNKNLQALFLDGGKKQYREVNEQLSFSTPVADSTAAMERILALSKDFEADEASVIIKDATGIFRLPKTAAAYDQQLAAGWPRGKRELESERFMLNAHGTLYEVGRESGYAAIRPITTHRKAIQDYCTWRGLLVISGVRQGAAADGHVFGEASQGLWFGAIDDLWQLGKPVGTGGPWKNTRVKAQEPSLPYLMTGYDKKKVQLTASRDVTITLEVDVDYQGWHPYKKIGIKAGETVEHVFPEGYNAHWIRVVADQDCEATAWFLYE